MVLRSPYVLSAELKPWRLAKVSAARQGFHTDLCLQSDKLQSLIKAAGVEEVEPIWTSIFAKVRIRCAPRRYSSTIV